MKKFVSIFALTVFATIQALKITESIGEQAQMGQKLKTKLGAPTISSIASEIQGVSSSSASVQQSITQSQSAINSTTTALSNVQQSINQLAQQIQNQNISFSSIGSQLVNLNSNISSSIILALQGSSNLTQASNQASSTTQQVSQLSSDYNNFINGTDSLTMNIVTLPNCYFDAINLGNPSRGFPFQNTVIKTIYVTSLQDAIDQYKSVASYGSNTGYWKNDRGQQVLWIIQYGSQTQFICNPNPPTQPNSAILMPMKGGIITQASNF